MASFFFRGFRGRAPDFQQPDPFSGLLSDGLPPDDRIMGRRKGKVRRRSARDVVRQSASLTLEQAVRRFDDMHSRELEMVSVAESYRQSVWVYGAISQIAGSVSRAPFRVYGPGDRPVESGDIVRFVNQPNRYDQQNTSTKFRNAYLTELLLNGAVCRVFSAMEGFRPAAMVALPRWRFRVDGTVDDAGIETPVRWHLRTRGRSIPYTSEDDLYHDGLYNPYHDWEGLAPLTAAMLDINNDVDSAEFAHRFFKNDSSTGLVFTSEHPSFNQAAADEAVRRWQDQHAGKSRAFGAKFVGFGLKPHQVGSSFDAKMHNVLKTLTKEMIVTGIFKIPLETFGAESVSSGVVIGDRQSDTAQESFLVNVVMPWSMRYDEEFDNDVAWRFGAQYRGAHDFTGHPLLEKRRLERAKAATELIDRGVPLNAVIKWLKLELAPVPWGDDFWVPSNMIPAEVIRKAGERALFDRTPSPSNAGGKPGKPGVRDKGGRPAKTEAALDAYVDDIVRLSDTAAVKNAVRPSNNGNGVAARLAPYLREWVS